MGATAIREKTKAAANAKIAQRVEELLPKALEAKVSGKSAKALSKASLAVTDKLRKAAAAKLAADIARDTANKKGNEKETIKATLKQKSDAKLKADITQATSSKNMKALQAKLKSDLAKELKPSTEAELRAKVTAQQDTKDEAKIAKKTQDAGKQAAAMS